MSDDHPIADGTPVPAPIDLVVVDGVAVAVPPAPDGWQVVPTDGDPRGYVYRPDPDHPLYPANAILREKPQYQRWLESDPDLVDFIARHRAAYVARIDELVARSGTVPVTVLVAEARQIAASIADAARGLGRPDLPRWLVGEYLAQRLVGGGGVGLEGIRSLLSVSLYAASDGTIVAAFTAASKTHRDYWEPLIRNFQRSFGFRQDEGGRTPVGVEDIAAVIRELDAAGTTPTVAAVGKVLYGGPGGAKNPADSLYQRVKTLRAQGLIRDWKDLVHRVLAAPNGGS